MDSNVPMYAVGSDAAMGEVAQRAVQRLLASGERLVTDAEVFQELLHRYAAIRRLEAVQPAFDALRSVVSEVYPVEERHVFAAKDILLRHKGLSSRDAVHAAVMRSAGVATILSADAGFDALSGITRIKPA